MKNNFNQEYIAKLSKNARQSLFGAQFVAKELGVESVSTEHLLLGILMQKDSTASLILQRNGVTLEKAEDVLGVRVHQKDEIEEILPMSETVLLSIRMALIFVRDYNHELIGTTHLLASLLTRRVSTAHYVLQQLYVNIGEIKSDIDYALARQSEGFFEKENTDESTTIERETGSKKSLLAIYGRDLTEEAKKSKLDRVVGREGEIRRLITVLSRRQKNNPMLVGDPGVGKTAIVEAVADMISRGGAPDYMMNMRIIQLDMTAMLAGTRYRGDFEERLKSIMNEVSERKNITLFVDEIHSLVGAGSANGDNSNAAGNIMKPALARGEFRMIGATTHEEYQKHIEKDPAFARRFQKIDVEEPTLAETTKILLGLKSNYEKHHGIEISEEIIKEVVHVADRYISNRQMPDKAIDVLDEAASHVRVGQGFGAGEIQMYQKFLTESKNELENAIEKDDGAMVSQHEFMIATLEKKIKQAKRKIPSKKKMQLKSKHVTKAVSVMTGIPAQKVQSSELKLLKNLENHLAQKVIGQEVAIRAIAKSVRRNRSGISDVKKPIGSFVFLGPTGVGKTELARALAYEVFGSESSLIKIDMSEYSEKHTASKLLGSPAGYVGHEDGGHLTEKVKKKPYSVVLFDEVEKAHPEIFNILLQILDDGMITDSKNRKVSFRHTIIILTSNIGAKYLLSNDELGFNSNKIESMIAKNKQVNKQVIDELKKIFSPELMNRFDDVIVFDKLDKSELEKILNLHIEKMTERLSEAGYGLAVSSRTKKWLVDEGYDEKNGARPLRRLLEKTIESMIADKILNDDLQKGDIIKVGFKKNQITLDVKREVKELVDG